MEVIEMFTMYVKQEGYPIAKLYASTEQQLNQMIYFNSVESDLVEWSEDKYTVTITKL
jgi:hypothetical protein